MAGDFGRLWISTSLTLTPVLSRPSLDMPYVLCSFTLFVYAQFVSFMISQQNKMNILGTAQYALNCTATYIELMFVVKQRGWESATLE